jgi:hypothetical protein
MRPHTSVALPCHLMLQFRSAAAFQRAGGSPEACRGRDGAPAHLTMRSDFFGNGRSAFELFGMS